MNSTNKTVTESVELLGSSESKLLSRLAKDLSKPSRIRREVNLSRLNHHTKENEFIVVPGKVLGGGELKHKITISALKFSQSAKDKLAQNGSTIVPLADLAKENLSGKKVRIIG